MVTLLWSFLIEFLPNFIYGLLPSNSHSSSNMGFVRRTITIMTDKIAATYQCPLSWSLIVIFNLISSKFHIWFACIKPSFKFGYGFCSTNDNQDCRQNGRRLSVCFCGHATLVIYYRIASKFHIWITFIKLSPNFKYGLCPINKMATTCQLALVDTTLIIYNPISSKFHVWTTIKLLFMSEYEFCLMNENHDCRQNGYPFFTAGH